MRPLICEARKDYHIMKTRHPEKRAAVIQMLTEGHVPGKHRDPKVMACVLKFCETYSRSIAVTGIEGKKEHTHQQYLAKLKFKEGIRGRTNRDLLLTAALNDPNVNDYPCLALVNFT